MIEVQLKRSRIGVNPQQREALRCLGFKKTNQIRKLKNTAAVAGQMRKIQHLVRVIHQGDKK